MKHILKKIDENPDFLFAPSSPFKTVYPNLFLTSDYSPNESAYYHAVVDIILKHFSDSKDELIVLQRLESIIDKESSVQHYGSTLKLLALC
jgi:hypothetical protein